MRPVGLVIIALALASPAMAQPEPAAAPPAATETPPDVAVVLEALDILAEREAMRAAMEPASRPAARATTSGSRLQRGEGAGVSNVRISRGCPSGALESCSDG